MVKQSNIDSSAQSWSSKTKSTNIRRRRLLILAAAFIAGGVGLYLVLPTARNFYDNNLTGGEDCTNSKREDCVLLNEAVKNLDPTKIQDLNATVEKIKRIDGYTNNQNLLYVLVIYDINRSDGDAGRKDLNRLKKVYSKAGYDKVLSKIDASVPSTLEVQVKALEEQEQQVKKNSWGIKPDGSTQQGVQ